MLSIRNFLYRDTWWMELCSASILLVWAIVLIVPPPTFGSSPSYDMMAHWAPESFWATLATVIASFGLWGLKKGSSWPRAVGLLGGVFFWGTVGVTIIFSNHASTGGWVYLAIANLCGLAYVFGRR